MRFLICLAALYLITPASTAAAQRYHYDRQIEAEAQLGMTMGGGWMDASVGSVAASTGMDLTWGGSARLGFAIPAADTVGIVLALHGDLLSMGDVEDRFLVSNAAGLFGVRLHTYDRGSFLVGGLLGLAASDHRALMQDGGLTFAGLIGYRIDHLFVEARYQVWAFETSTRMPDPNVPNSTIYVDVTIRQLLFSVGIAI